MRRLVVLVFSMVAVLGAGLSPAQAATTGSISGKVTDAAGTPLSGVTVLVIPQISWAEDFLQTTGESGTFSVAGLEAGDYQVCFLTTEDTSGGASTTGYVDVCWHDVQIPMGIPAEGMSTVAVSLGTDTGGVVQAMPEGGGITGFVTDASGQPISGAEVTASSDTGYPPSGHAITGLDGSYRIDHLYAGEFYVCATTEEATGGSSVTGYLDGCVGGGLSQGGRPYGADPATAVQVSSGEVAASPDVELKSAGQLTGTLTNQDGQPIAGVTVYGWGEDQNGMGVTATDVTDVDGRYLLSVDNDNGSANGVYHGARLPLGGFRLLFSPGSSVYVKSYYPHVPAPGNESWGPVPEITPAAGVPTVLDDTLPFAGSLGGTVTDSADNPLEDVTVVVRRGATQVLDAHTSIDGTYTIAGLPEADYTVCFEAGGARGGISQIGYLNRCSDGTPTNDPATVSLGPAQHRNDVGGALPSASAIAGTVRNGSGQTIYGVRVSFRINGVEVAARWSNGNGTFGSGPLPAGQYTVCFTPASTASAIYQGECWHDQPLDAADPTQVTATAGSRSTLDVILSEEPSQQDTTPPSITLSSPSALFATGREVKASYLATDADSGVLSHDIRYRVAAWNGTFGPWIQPAAWQNRTATTVALTGKPGGTYCISARARDAKGNVSAWTPEKCRVVALDDRSLTASSSWRRLTGASSYQGTYTQSSSRGATLKLTGARTAHLAVVFTACSRCGKVGVYVGGRLIATINTYSATTRRQVLRIAPGISLSGSTITLKVLQRRAVIVDGLVVTRR